jgi:hypothetical protein
MARIRVFLIAFPSLISSLLGQTSGSLPAPRTAAIRFDSKASTSGGSDIAVLPVSGPTLTYVFDSEAGGIRRVLGVGGSAFVGDRVSIGQTLSAAHTSPQQDYVVGLSETRQVILITISHGAVIAVSPLASVPASPDKIVFSPSGNSVGLYYSKTTTAIFLNGVPANAAPGSVWDLSQYGGAVSSLAVQDNGVGLAGITLGGGSGSLVFLAANGSTRALTAAGTPSAIQFLWGQNNAIVADSSRGTVNLLRNVGGALESLALVREGDGPAHPDLVAVDRFSQRAVVAQQATNSGLSIDLSSGALQPFACNCSISGLEPLNGISIYRVSDYSRGQFGVLEAAEGVVRFSIIGVSPAARRVRSLDR